MRASRRQHGFGIGAGALLAAALTITLASAGLSAGPVAAASSLMAAKSLTAPRSIALASSVTAVGSAVAAGSAAAGSAAARFVGHDGRLTTIGVGRLPSSVAVDSTLGKVWVVNSQDGTVSEISEATRAVVATIKVGTSPVDVAADPKTGTVWVTCLGPFDDPSADDTVAEISETSGKVVATIKVGQAPFGIAADPRTGTVWVADSGADAVSEISESSATVTATISTGKDAAPVGIAVDPDTEGIWVVRLNAAIEEIDETTKSIFSTIDVGSGTRPSSLNAIAVDPESDEVWVASDQYAGGSVYSGLASEVNPHGRKVVARVPVPLSGLFGNIPDAIAIDSASGTIWVAENGENTVTLISEAGRTVARNLPTGADPVAVAVDSRTKTAWIVNNADSTVTEYSYGRPVITTSALVKLSAGKAARFLVQARGFPTPVVAVHGALPPGLRLRLEVGAVVISGTPPRSARGHTYHVTVSAGNGIDTASGQPAALQQLTIEIH